MQKLWIFLLGVVAGCFLSLIVPFGNTQDDATTNEPIAEQQAPAPAPEPQPKPKPKAKPQPKPQPQPQPAPADDVSSLAPKHMQGITLAEQPTEFTAGRRFKVGQVLEHGALARTEYSSGSSVFTDPMVYIPVDGQNMFYDDQIIEVPKGQTPVQIGTYRNRSVLYDKVVPVLRFQ